MRISEVPDSHLKWGESVVWDDRRQRLYFVDCMARTLHWLDDGDAVMATWTLPMMPTGVVPTTDDRLVIVLDDGLYVADPDALTLERLTGFPDELDGARCNDACADLDGNIITGKLNLGPAEGSAWRWSASAGWSLLDPDIANTNGPTVGIIGGVQTLIIGDTSANYYAYDYDGSSAPGPRRVFGDVSNVDGMPDGATLDAEGGLWCALVRGGQLARFTAGGLDLTIHLDLPNPTDVTFGGAALDRLFVTAIDGPLMVIDGLDVRGRPEPRASIA